jgi:hypothetical protein
LAAARSAGLAKGQVGLGVGGCLLERPRGQPRGLGLTWNMLLDGGGLLVSSQIRIEIEMEAVLDA